MDKKFNKHETQKFINAILAVDPNGVRSALKNNADPTPVLKTDLNVWHAQLRVPANEVAPHGTCTALDKHAALLTDVLPLDNMQSVKWLGLAGHVPIASADANEVRMGPSSFSNAVLAAVFDMFTSIVGDRPEVDSDEQIAALARAKEIIDLCLIHKCNLAGSDARGMTVLHWCCALYDDKELVERLVAVGGTPTIKDKDGYTSIDVAAQYGHLNSFAGLNVREQEKKDGNLATAPTQDDLAKIDWSELEPCNDFISTSPSPSAAPPTAPASKPPSRLAMFFNVLLGRTSPLDNEH
ncbi:TPA: ankyrin repeat domain-containing protein [Stenotrophomonas maltophilia]